MPVFTPPRTEFDISSAGLPLALRAVDHADARLAGASPSASA